MIWVEIPNVQRVLLPSESTQTLQKQYIEVVVQAFCALHGNMLNRLEIINIINGEKKNQKIGYQSLKDQ